MRVYNRLLAVAFCCACMPLLTATKYLDVLAESGFLQKQKIGRSNYYVNLALNRILLDQHGE